MGKNKLKKFAEMAAFDHVFQADFDDLREGGFVNRGRWGRAFFGNDNPIVLELGCGKGEYTVGLAKLFPHKNFIGIDIKGARMHTGARQAMDEGLRNVAFVRTRIEFIERFFAPDEVDEVWITFPDPQMKKARKRLVGTLMLTRYMQFLKSGGLVHLKTDSRFLLTYVQHLLQRNGIEPAVMLDDLYHSDFDDPILGIRTFYESKWIDYGLSIKYVRFGLEHRSLEEPDVEIEFDNYHSAGRGVGVRTRTARQTDQKQD